MEDGTRCELCLIFFGVIIIRRMLIMINEGQVNLGLSELKELRGK